MALIEMIMPRMGESIFECTVLNWLKNVGDRIEADDMVVEVATDKIDTEVGTSHTGILKEILVKQGDIAEIGKPICLIETDVLATKEVEKEPINPNSSVEILEKEMEGFIHSSLSLPHFSTESSRFYSPLVLNIAKEEGISMEELNKIHGSGLENRVTKNDILAFISRKSKDNQSSFASKTTNGQAKNTVFSSNGQDEIIEMDRMRKMIADRMVESKRISPHATSFVETDMTNIVLWREKNKEHFKQKTGENITYTPILLEAVVKAIKDFPMINIQVDGNKIIRKTHINIGMAVALSNGNLIVPVIQDADSYSLIGLTKKVNDLTNRARNNKLTADDLADGTYTVSNIGTFGNVMGTPIIMQPQVAIMAFGVIQKKPAVIETPMGDLLGIRHKMFISHAFDHRVVDGSLGGQFVKRVSDYLENFQMTEL